MEYTQDDKALEEYLKGMPDPGAAPATSPVAPIVAGSAHPIAVDPSASVSATPAKKIEKRKKNECSYSLHMPNELWSDG